MSYLPRAALQTQNVISSLVSANYNYNQVTAVLGACEQNIHLMNIFIIHLNEYFHLIELSVHSINSNAHWCQPEPLRH